MFPEEHMLDLFRLIFAKDNVTPYGENDRRVCVWSSIILAFVALVLTAMNVAKHYWFMAVTTTILIVGFLVSAFAAGKNRLSICRTLLAVICAGMFSVYAITGQNDGFAILWILLIPVLSSFLIGLKKAFFLSLYFQVFLIVLFYTPLSGYVASHYTETFMMRFPMLYFASFAMIMFVMCHRQQLLNDVDKQANVDALTGLYNRNRYEKMLKKAEYSDEYSSLTILAFDLNQVKEVNDSFGHEAGDEMIRGAAEVIREAFKGDMCFRTGGDEFMVISSRQNVTRSLDAMRKAMEKWRGRMVKSINISAGYASREQNPKLSVVELCKLADRNMYIDKCNFYQENGENARRAPR